MYFLVKVFGEGSTTVHHMIPSGKVSLINSDRNLKDGE